MDNPIEVQPLSHNTRKRAFAFAVLVFIISLPFLYMYATGYRFDVQKPTTLVSTGGLYIAVERTGAEIYIDGELMRETRTFRKAFYAQGLDVGTHRVHVQKEGFHTWVKELPVSKRLVTESEAFNLPLVPQVRVISEWVSATGTAIVPALLANASSTNELIATSTRRTNLFTKNLEYQDLVRLFATTTSTSTESGSTAQQIKDIILRTGTTTTESVDETATTTKHANGVRLYEIEDEVFATWEGSFEQMPYYYCASDFPPYSTTTASSTVYDMADIDEEEIVDESFVMHPVQTVTQDASCDPTIRIGANNRDIRAFDFFPGSNDLVLVLLDDGVYVTEIDDRAWQNMQPLFLGEDLRMSTMGGSIYIFDGTLIYQVILTVE